MTKKELPFVPKAVVFDMDGVIIHSNPYHLPAWIAFGKLYGLTITEDYYKKHISGKTNKAILDMLFHIDVDITEARRMGEEKEAQFRQLFATHLKPIAGFTEFANALRLQKIPMAVATNAPYSNLEFVLKGLKIGHYFRETFDESMVKNGKPDPEIYLKAIHALGATPKETLIFEDSPAGVQAGVDAGATVIGLTTTHTPSHLPGIAMSIKDFNELAF